MPADDDVPPWPPKPPIKEKDKPLAASVSIIVTPPLEPAVPFPLAPEKPAPPAPPAPMVMSMSGSSVKNSVAATVNRKYLPPEPPPPPMAPDAFPPPPPPPPEQITSHKRSFAAAFGVYVVVELKVCASSKVIAPVGPVGPVGPLGPVGPVTVCACNFQAPGPPALMALNSHVWSPSVNTCPSVGDEGKLIGTRDSHFKNQRQRLVSGHYLKFGGNVFL